MKAAHPSLPVGTLVSSRQGLPRLVIGIKPSGQVMTVGAPDPPWMLVGHIEVADPSAYELLDPADLPSFEEVYGSASAG
ncbi:MAG TPA: hypothetical protein DEA08_10075, partial [Planctomycetes bacterium]|nr:hypothetical protein [Planctomycetota bacterium]